MNDLIKELKTVIKKKRLSQEAASIYIGCSSRTVFRWLHGLKKPNLTSQRLIQEGLDKIRAAYPDKKIIRPRFQILDAFCIDDLRKMPEGEKDFWEMIISKMNDTETKTVYWFGKDKKTMKEQILKAAKRLNISYPE